MNADERVCLGKPVLGVGTLLRYGDMRVTKQKGNELRGSRGPDFK